MIEALQKPTDFAHFQALDIRVAEIIAVDDFPRARNPSYKLHLDFGELGEKQSSAQITSYSKDELLGRRVVCVANFPPRNIAGFQSEVLVLGVYNTKGDVRLLAAPDDVPLGGKVC